MAKQKVTLTLDAENVAVLRLLVGSRSLSAAVDAAIVERLARLRHLATVDEWLAELDAEYGPVPPETLEWAARLVDDWDARGAAPPRVGGGPAECCSWTVRRFRPSSTVRRCGGTG